MEDAIHVAFFEATLVLCGVYAIRHAGVQPKPENKLSALSAEFNTMKVVNKLALLTLVSALLPIALSAKTRESAYLENCRKDPAVPVPVTVVSPTVSSEYAGATVEVEFTVDATGKPIELAVKSAPDRSLGLDVLDAVKQWRFMPAHSNGAPVAIKVVLPVKIVEPELEGTRYAVN